MTTNPGGTGNAMRGCVATTLRGPGTLKVEIAGVTVEVTAQGFLQPNPGVAALAFDETVEAAVNKVLGLDGETERRIAIVGVPDEQKGEAILLLSTIAGPAHEQECIDLRYKLLDEGLSSLWCPKTIVPVTEIPVLASGKLDIKGCEALVKRG